MMPAMLYQSASNVPLPTILTVNDFSAAQSSNLSNRRFQIT
jgi:hypothetical protein